MFASSEHACDQRHSSRESTAFTVVTINHVETLKALCEAVSFNAMKANKGSAVPGAGAPLGSMLLRKGVIGDWVNHLTAEDWERFDKVYDERLGNIAIAKPMKHFMYLSIPGLPPPLAKQTVAADTREYNKFVRVLLTDGMVVPDTLIAAGSGSAFVRPMSEFNGVIEAAGSGAKFEAEAGRYHLFAAGTCPWASGCMAVRHAVGLDAVISADWACGQSGAGWVFQSGTVRVFRREFTLEDAIGSHACSFEALACV
jgi:hypothetical protein